MVEPGGLLTGLTKSVVETALEEELSDHLGYDKHDPAGVATLSKSRQLSAELSSVADDALRNQREQADAMQAAVDERRDLLDRISTDLSDVLGSRPAR